MKIKVTLVVLFLIGLSGVYLSLNYSSRFNNIVFSNLINPYDPLEVQYSQPVKKDSIINEFWEDPRGLFPIMAFNLPEKSKDLTASLRVIEKGGVNLIINGSLGLMPTPEKVKTAFNKLGSSDLMWLPILATECRDDFIFGNENDDINKDIQKYLNNYNDNFVYGWFVWDEPGENRKTCSPLNFIPNDDYADIDRMVEQIRSDSVFNKKLDYINLFPTYWHKTESLEDYENYVDAFFTSQKYKPRVLCFDHYPNRNEKDGGFRNDYYSNLEVIRKKSLQYDVPFWMIVLSSEHLNYRKPNYEDISLQVYSALAYGAKGIGYYLYSKCWEQISYKSWILEEFVDDPTVADSLHGPLFVPIQRLNKRIQILGQILEKLKSISVFHSSNYPNNQINIKQNIIKEDLSKSTIKNIYNDVGTDPKVLVGLFKERENPVSESRYLFVVNKKVNSSTIVNIDFEKSYNLFLVSGEDGSKRFIKKSDSIQLTLGKGLGELYFIE